MSRKVEIRTRMAELQKEFATLNAELKEIDDIEKRAVARDRYQDYKYKVGTYGYAIETEDKIKDVTDEDREVAGVGQSGLVYTGFGDNSDYGYVMLKDKSEYTRAKSVLIKLDAVTHLTSDKVKDKEKYIKILLGEQDPNTETK